MKQANSMNRETHLTNTALYLFLTTERTAII